MKLHGREHQITAGTALRAYMKASAELEQVLTNIEKNRPAPFNRAAWLKSLKKGDPIRARAWGFTVYFHALRPARSNPPGPAGVEYTLTPDGAYIGNWDSEVGVSPIPADDWDTTSERLAEAQALLRATAEVEYMRGRLDALLGEVNTETDSYRRGVLDSEAVLRGEL